MLKYKIVERKDISYPGVRRMVFRVVMEAVKLPSEEQLKKIAIDLWVNGNTVWDEFTVFIYLPNMDTNNIAYGVGEFNQKGLKELIINQDALMITKLKGDI